MRLLIIANPTSPATDYYRTTGVLVRLSEAYTDVTLDIQYPTTVKWHHMFACDAVVVNRPNGDDVLNIILESKRMGKKIVVDMDDLLHELSDANPAAGHFRKPNVVQSINNALSLCDLLFVSTPHLAKFYTSYVNCPVHVVPNCPDLKSTPFAPLKEQSKPVRIFWRGSSTHLEDLFTINQALNAQSTRESALSFMFVGIERYLVAWYNCSGTFVPWQTLFALFDNMNKAGLDWGFFPLVNDNFNQAKSNIFALEMLVAGAAVLAPEGFEEFNHPGVIKYSNAKHLTQLFSEVGARKFNKIDIVQAGRAWVIENRDLAKWNEARYKALMSL